MNCDIDISGVVLKTNRLLLREWTENDLQDFFGYCSEDGVGQMAGWAPHENIEKSKQILDLFIGEKKTFCIDFGGKAIGSVGIEKYDESKFPEYANLKGREIGFVLSKAYWGRGIMPEAVKAVIKYCFEDLGCDFLMCGYFVWNTQSKRVQQKCGFRYLKTIDYVTRMGTHEQTDENVLFASEFEKGQLLKNFDSIHTTASSEKRVSKNLGIESNVVDYCKKIVLQEDCKVSRRGKNFYANTADVQITINANSHTIITAHKSAKKA